MSKKNELFDEELVMQLGQGCEATYKKVFELYNERLVKFASNIVGAGHAEDAVNQTWMQVVLSIGSFRCDCPLIYWLYRVVRNKCYTILNKEEKYNQSKARFENNEAGRENSFGYMKPHPVSSEDPFNHVVSIKLLDRFCDYFDKLNSVHQSAIHAELMTKASLKENAVKNGLSNVNARVFIHRARQQFIQQCEFSL